MSDATASPIHVTTAPPPLLPARGIEPRAHCCSGIASRQLHHSPLSLPLSSELELSSREQQHPSGMPPERRPPLPAWAWNFPRRTADVAFFFSEAFLLNQDLIWLAANQSCGLNFKPWPLTVRISSEAVKWDFLGRELNIFQRNTSCSAVLLVLFSRLLYCAQPRAGTNIRRLRVTTTVSPPATFSISAAAAAL